MGSEEADEEKIGESTDTGDQNRHEQFCKKAGKAARALTETTETGTQKLKCITCPHIHICPHICYYSWAGIRMTQSSPRDHRYEMRMLLFTYHIFWAISGIYPYLFRATASKAFGISHLMFGMFSLAVAIGLLFKFPNKMVVYALSLIFNILFMVALIRTQITNPSLLGLSAFILFIIVAILIVNTAKIIYKLAFSRVSRADW